MKRLTADRRPDGQPIGMRKPLANAPPPSALSRTGLILAPLAASVLLVGCSGLGNAAVAQEAGCAVRVIVRLAAEPDAALVADVERANSLELEPLSSITSDLRVFMLRAVGSDNDCADAIERLRSDPRVRSVDVDARRELHDD